jgi:thioredoxin
MSEEEELKEIRKKKEELLKKIIAMPGEIVHINTPDEFNSLVEQYKDQVIVIDFWADWCQPCKMFAPIFEAAQQKWGTDYVFAKLDTEALPQVSQALGVMGIPMLLFIKNKTEIHRQSGALRKGQFDRLLQQVKSAVQKQGSNDNSMYS